MAEFTLRLTASEEVAAEEAKTSFYWLDDARSTFTSSLGPNLSSLGQVKDLNIDFVRIALTVVSADKSVLRKSGGSNWNQRNIKLTIPVSDPAKWESVSDDLQQVVGFLSGDKWSFNFIQQESTPEQAMLPKITARPERVVLLSGGADSASGAVYSRSLLQDGQTHILLSHFSSTTLAPVQRNLASEVERLITGGAQQHIAVHLSRGSKRIDGTNYPTEPSSRSRSLLFIALGLAVASVHEVPLWIPENGFASINPPLGPERLGSLSTRTTHPSFLQDLSVILEKIGAQSHIENPFADMTKGEMFKRVAEIIGEENAASFLSSTNSCAHTHQRYMSVSASKSCGVCFGCVLRRASFVSSGIEDRTEYMNIEPDQATAEWLSKVSVEQQIKNFIRRGVSGKDLATLALPRNYSINSALGLCERAIGELRSLY